MVMHVRERAHVYRATHDDPLAEAIEREFGGKSYPADQRGRDALARRVADFILAWMRERYPDEEYVGCELAGLIDGKFASSLPIGGRGPGGGRVR